MEDRMLKGYFLGPFKEGKPLPHWLTNGAKPLFHPMFGKYELKSDGKIKTRLLFNLSDDSNGPSFNDNIPADEKTVTYITILDVCRRIVDCDMKWLWCLDALEAYYRVPIQRRFIPLMGVKICNLLFFFTCLVMGQASACRLYTEFADAVTWIISNDKEALFKYRRSGAGSDSPELEMIMHYIDDFMGGHTQKEAARQQFEAVKEWWVRLGIPTQDRKCSPPTEVLLYLGFLFNARRRTLAVPDARLKKYKAALAAIKWHGRPSSKTANGRNNQKMTVLELQRAVGQIRSIQCVYPYVVPALRNLEEVSSDPNRNQWDRVRIDARMMSGVKVIEAALNDARRREMPFAWLLHPRDAGNIEVYTDASTKFGVGGFEDIINGRHYGLNWCDTTGWGVYAYKPDITYLELLGVVLAADLFGAQWSGKAIKLRCDNAAVCMMVRRKAACFRRRDLNALLLVLCELATRYRFYFWIIHIAGEKNKIADGLSRNQKAAAAADIARNRLSTVHVDAVPATNKLLATWRDNARYVIKARFAKARKEACKCDHDTDSTRRQCFRLNKPLDLNEAYDIATMGNRAQRRAAEWERRQRNDSRPPI